MLGRRIGLIAGLFYATMFLPVALVQLPTHDVALVAWVNLALFCFWESDWGGSPQRAWAWTVAAGAVLGLAVLTKGLAGVALAGISYGGYLIVSRRLRPIHGCRADWPWPWRQSSARGGTLPWSAPTRATCTITSSVATCLVSSPTRSRTAWNLGGITFPCSPLVGCPGLPICRC